MLFKLASRILPGLFQLQFRAVVVVVVAVAVIFSEKKTYQTALPEAWTPKARGQRTKRHSQNTKKTTTATSTALHPALATATNLAN